MILCENYIPVWKYNGLNTEKNIIQETLLSFPKRVDPNNNYDLAGTRLVTTLFGSAGTNGVALLSELKSGTTSSALLPIVSTGTLAVGELKNTKAGTWGSVSDDAVLKLDSNDNRVVTSTGGTGASILGSAGVYAILAGTGITFTTSATVDGGDIGSSPTSTQTGAVTLTNGTNHTAANPNDAQTVQAKVDLVAAYNYLFAQTPTALISANLGGQTLTPGVYKDNGAPASLAITGTLTLNAQGNPNAIFIFQSATTLTVANSGIVALTNGAQASNVYWLCGSSAVIGTSATFKGNIVALTAITVGTSSNVAGKLLARNATVTVDTLTMTSSAAGIGGGFEYMSLNELGTNPITTFAKFNGSTIATANGSQLISTSADKAMTHAIQINVNGQPMWLMATNIQPS